MLFNSFEFIFLFLPVVLSVYFLLNLLKWDKPSKLWLLGASLFFYSWWNINYLPILLITLVVNGIIGKILIKNTTKISSKIILIIGIIFNVGLLGYFKYMDFFILNINALTSFELNTLNIVLPLGISFFTFQIIAYIIDAYKGKVENNNFFDFALFISFFPQLIAGPIALHKDVIPQFEDNANRKINMSNIATGFFMFSIGLFKKVVIADTFAEWANLGYSNLDVLTTLEAWISTFSYTFQLYFDFSGYSDMAIGLGLLFNIKLPINFNSPYKALSIQDFWRRWHITLSNFLNNYLYVPLGGSKKNIYRTYINIMIIFLVSGFWHGAGWNFIIWGGLHGTAMCLHRLWKSYNLKLPKVLAWLITFNFVNLTWVIFRSSTMNNAFNMIQKMFEFGEEGSFSLSTFGYVLNKYFSIFQTPGMPIPQQYPIVAIISFLFIFLITIVLNTKCKNSYEIMHSYTPNTKTALLVAILFSVSLFNMQRITEFLYFNF